MAGLRVESNLYTRKPAPRQLNLNLMYKKQLTLTIAIYLAILFMFTACNFEAIGSTEVSEPIVSVAQAQQDEAEIGESNLIEPEVEQKNSESTVAQPESSNQMSSPNMSAGNNNMMGSAAIPTITNFPEDDIDSADERQALEIFVQEKAIALLLADQDAWHVEMWFNDEEQRIEIDLFDAEWEWLSWGSVSLDENTVLEMYAPQPLTAEEYQTQQAQAESVVLKNGEVLAVLGDLTQWERYAWYDEWEGAWEIAFYRGLDEIVVRVESYDGEMMVGSIENLALLTEEEQLAENRNQAIELAWQAEGVDEALFGSDEDIEWQTFVTHIEDGRYGVSFATADQELFFALVDIDSQQIVESD